MIVDRLADLFMGLSERLMLPCHGSFIFRPRSEPEEYRYKRRNLRCAIEFSFEHQMQSSFSVFA